MKERKRGKKDGRLTALEKKRIKELRRILAGGEKRRKVPETAQETITFRRLYQNGICKVTDTFYTKMVEFYDINYELLDAPQQGDVLQAYSELINYFEPGIKFQLFLFNRKVSEEVLVRRIHIPAKEDGFDDIRREFSRMLKNRMTRGNNGVIKSKYLVFGIEAENYKEARSRLAGIEAGIIRNLRGIGTAVRVMDGKERLCVLHEYFNQDSMEPFRFSYEDLKRSGRTERDFVAPPGFDFRSPGRFKSGNIYGCVSFLDITAPRLGDGLLKRLLDIDDSITVTVHMETLDALRAVKMLKSTLTNVQKMKIDEQKKAVRSGYDMDILPTDILLYEKDTLDLLEDLNTSNQKMISMTFLITCYGSTKREMESLVQRVSGIIQQANCNLRRLQYLQEKGLMASAPIGCNDTGIERVLNTKSSAILVPFSTQELFMPSPALYYGLNALSNNMILADRKKLRTPNGMILGTPGSGKSFAAKREILGCFLMTEDDIVVCDPEGEYFPLIEALNGQVIRLAAGSPDYLNPMDIQKSHIGDEDALRLKSDFLITLCDVIAGGKDGLTNDEKGIIDKCIGKVYQKYFQCPEPGNMPVLGDLHKNLKENPMTQRIAVIVSRFVTGSAQSFNQQTNVDLGNKYIVLDLSELKGKLLPVGMMIALDYVWDKVKSDRTKKKAIMIDEIWQLVGASSNRMAAEFCLTIFKTIRGFGGAAISATQDLTDFFSLEDGKYGRAIVNNSKNKIILNLEPDEARYVKEVLKLTQAELRSITQFERGEALVYSNNNKVPVVIKASNEEQEMITTDRAELEAILKERQKGQGVVENG